MEALILVATSGGPAMFARIGFMRALNRHVERVFNPDRKDHNWGRRKLIAYPAGFVPEKPACARSVHRSDSLSGTLRHPRNHYAGSTKRP
jgi:hypothetical protein